MADRAAVLVSNMGGPRSPEEVEPFLYRLFADPDLIHLPLQPRGGAFQRFVARRISRGRAPKVMPEYARMEGGSPLVSTTEAQAHALAGVLQARMGEAAPTVHAAFSYSPPYLDEGVAEALAAGATRLVSLPLYPHYSGTTTGSVHNDVSDVLQATAPGVLMTPAPPFYDHAGYIEAVCDRIWEALGDPEASAAPDDVFLLFSAHGLPARYVRQGDPYQRQIQESVRLIVHRLAHPGAGGASPAGTMADPTLGTSASRPPWRGRWGLSYQSRVGPVRWLGPATEDEVQRLPREDSARHLVVVPIAFVGDHLETLVELGHTYAALARAAGAESFRVTRGLDDHPALIHALADVAQRALGGGHDRLCFRCLVPREAAHFQTPRCADCKVKRPRFERRWRGDLGQDAG